MSKKCTVCGNINPDDTNTCIRCEAALPDYQTGQGVNMGYCPNCGEKLNPGERFCMKCGAAVQNINQDAVNGQQQYQQPQYQQQYQQPQYQQPYQQPQYQQQYQQPYQQPYQQQQYQQGGNGYNMNPPMKWHKFIVYFSMPAAMILYFAMAVMYITGRIQIMGVEGVSVQEVYDFFPNLKTADTMYGAYFIIMAIVTVIIWIQMLGFKRNAWKRFVAISIINMVVSILYLIVSTAVINAEIDYMSYSNQGISNISSSIISCLVMASINWTYYKKRDGMFIN